MSKIQETLDNIKDGLPMLRSTRPENWDQLTYQYFATSDGVEARKELAKHLARIPALVRALEHAVCIIDVLTSERACATKKGIRAEAKRELASILNRKPKA